MDFQIPHLAASNIKPLTKQHGISLHQLSKWNQHLDCQRLKTMHLQQDLKKQQKLAKQNQLLLNKQVHFIEQQAVLIASQLEQQKTKHEHLLVLVKNAEQLIYQEKLDKHQDVLNKMQPDEFEQCKKILFENEKKLEKILEKLNSSEFEISKKIDLIRSLRSERGIHSNVFDKLQKQLFDVKFFYTQLLIERTLLEKQLEKCASQFNHICHKSSLEISRMNQENKQSEGTQVTENGQTHHKNEKKMLTTFRIPELSFRDKEVHLTQRFKSRHDLANGSSIIQQKNFDQSKRLDFKKKLKSVLNDFGCQSFNEVLKKNIHKKLSEKDSAFDLSNQICDQIFTTENEIKKLEDQLHKRKNIQSNHLSSKKLNLNSQISEFQAQAELTKTQIINFSSEFENIVKNLASNSENQQNSPFNNFKTIKKGQNTEKLTFTENHQLLRQIMVFFNDQLFDAYLHDNRANSNSKSKFFCEKGFLKKKNHKISSIGFEKKVRIMRTQTDNSHQSINSMRNSECLDTILSMHNSGNEKFEKGEKTDNLSIMTENELIEESKRLIRQINKKKSEFLSNATMNKKQKLAA